MLQKETSEQNSDSIDALVDSLQRDHKRAELKRTDRAMIDYSVKLTIDPQSISAEDIQELRAHGFIDLAIHDIVCCVSYFAFVNRIADGLGVELER